MRAMHHALVPAALLIPLAASGCAGLLDIPDDPELVDSDLAAAQGPWYCVDSPEQAQEREAPTDGMATVRVQACNFISSNCSQSVQNVTATLCNKRDITCANPIATGIKGEDGLLTFEVPTGGRLGDGFEGYLSVQSPAASCADEKVFGAAGPALCALLPGCDEGAPDEACLLPEFAPALLFFNPPIVADQEQAVPLPLVPVASFGPILDAVGASSFDPSTGSLFITALDCDGLPAAGVRYTLDKNQGAVSELYVDNGNISSGASATDGSGLGGFVGVPAGFMTVTGLANGDDVVGEIGVYVAPFSVTYSTLIPGR